MTTTSRDEFFSQPGSRNRADARLLDDADQNIGNQLIVTAQPLLPGNFAQTTPLLDPPRLLALNSASKKAQLVTVVMGAALVPQVPGAPPIALGASGPITGIIEFGNGSVFNRIEFDVPVGPFQFAVNPKQPSFGCVMVTVPAGTLRVYARHDGSYCTPTFDTPSTTLLPPLNPSAPALVQAFATYFTRASTQSPRKTLYLGTAFNNSGQGFYSIPPGTKALRLLKGTPAFNNKAYTLIFTDSGSAGNILSFHSMAAGAEPTFVEVPGTANAVAVIGDAGTAAVPTSTLMLECELEC